MDKVQESSNSGCYTPSSEPFRINCIMLSLEQLRLKSDSLTLFFVVLLDEQSHIYHNNRSWANATCLSVAFHSIVFPTLLLTKKAVYSRTMYCHVIE
jgi:hypothetical protein